MAKSNPRSTPAALRARMPAAFEARVDILAQIADGRIPSEAGDRARARALLTRYQHTRVKEARTRDVRGNLEETICLVQRALTATEADRLVDAMRPIWEGTIAKKGT